ncbi:MAG: META domain-containing protein [Candidatus Electrothrix sp. Rat3]|nr:META domain-containing protein [Candidatus Electrothrix rattekaaiensis]
MRTYLRFFFLLVLFLAGCAPQQKHTLKGKATAFIHPLPAVFRADLALKRCPPTSFELVLRPDGLYFLQMEKNIFANDAVQAEMGVWRYNEEKKIVQLTSYDKAVRIFAITGKKVLKLIKVSGGIMPPLVRYDFTLTTSEPIYEGVVRVQGMYSRKRGRGVFRECLSGVSFPLLNQGRVAAAEQAYQDILHGRSESLLVTLDVRLSSRSGRGDRLIPVRSVHIDPYRSCKGKERRIATIADNRWYLIEVGGKMLEPETVSKSPFIKVQSGEQLIQGSAGCNNFTGSWLFANNEFVFSRIAATRMACPVGMEMEDAFLQALDNTRRYTIKGDTLRLHDQRGKVLARLRHSRQLTDLDFTLSSEQEEPNKDNLSDEIGVPENHSVEVEGVVPDSVAVPVIEASEKKNRSKASNSGNGNTNGRKITILKAKRKVAVRTTAPTDIFPGGVKEATPAPKTSVPIAVTERQEGKTEVPSAPEKREKSTEQEVEKKAPADQTEQSISPQQSNQVEEVTPSKASASASVLTSENNGQEEVQAEPELTGDRESITISSELESGETIPAGEETAQPMIQDSEDNGATPSLPPTSETEKDGQEVQPESTADEKSGETIPAGEETAQPMMQDSEDNGATPSLPPISETEKDGQEVQPESIADEKVESLNLSEPKEKIPTDDVAQLEIQNSEEKEVAPPSLPIPKAENEERAVQPEPQISGDGDI